MILKENKIGNQNRMKITSRNLENKFWNLQKIILTGYRMILRSLVVDTSTQFFKPDIFGVSFPYNPSSTPAF